ncbi:SPT20 [Candida metapsilosis]|uniref:SPT20 n=1 Tax=Candida metapsilosis TaxID=273372 RepID=A0A8H8DEP7_9ASCO|nr:SPT20 [Candida metapsilosis]
MAATDNQMSQEQITRDDALKLYTSALNFNVISRYDPAINQLVSHSSHCVLYKFNEESEEWVKTEYQGALALYERNAQNDFEKTSSSESQLQQEFKYGIIILNRSNPECFSLGILPESGMETIYRISGSRIKKSMTNLDIFNGTGSTVTDNRGPFNSNHTQHGELNLQKARVLQQKQQQQQQQQQQLQSSLKQRVNLRNYHFASTSEEILRKYSKYPASLSLHIFDNHYRFNNSQDSQIIPKSSPMIKSFMNHVLREEIPVELSELLKDFSIKSYDGCLILQVYDHRNMIETSSFRANASPSKDGKPVPVIVSKPRTYRVLLKPTPLSLYYDLLYHTDSALTKFTDTLSLQMESEILALTNRELDLSVKVNPYHYDYLKPDSDDANEKDTPHRAGVDVPVRKIHQDEMVLHKSSEYEELMLLLSNSNRRFEDTQDKKLVVVPPAISSATTTSSITTPPTKSTSKESSVGADSKGKKGEKSTGTSTMPTTVALSSNPIRTSGQFMRLRLIEEIRKRREIEKNQQEAKIQAQANSVQSEMLPQSGSVPAPIPAGSAIGSANVSNQPSMEPQVGGKRQQTKSQATNKRARKDTKQNQASGPNAQQVNQPVPLGPSNSQIPFAPSSSNSQISTMNNTPLMNNPAAPQQPNMSQVPTPQQMPMATPNLGQGTLPNSSHSHTPMGAAQNMQASPAPPLQQHAPYQPSLQQQQHQQIFQGSLTPEEQQVYKQIQSKMNALALMSQRGVAPNGQQLTPQHKQQAMQQVKILQQQLLQKFPVYFQRLKQFQLYQKQKQLQQQQQRQAAGVANIGGSGSPNLNGQFNNNMMQQPQQQLRQQQYLNQLPQGMTPLMPDAQPMNAVATPTQPGAPEPKKKRVYRKKTAK